MWVNCRGIICPLVLSAWLYSVTFWGICPADNDPSTDYLMRSIGLSSWQPYLGDIRLVPISHPRASFSLPHSSHEPITVPGTFERILRHGVWATLTSSMEHSKFSINICWIVDLGTETNGEIPPVLKAGSITCGLGSCGQLRPILRTELQGKVETQETWRDLESKNVGWLPGLPKAQLQTTIFE